MGRQEEKKKATNDQRQRLKGRNKGQIKRKKSWTLHCSFARQIKPPRAMLNHRNSYLEGHEMPLSNLPEWIWKECKVCNNIRLWLYGRSTSVFCPNRFSPVLPVRYPAIKLYPVGEKLLSVLAGTSVSLGACFGQLFFVQYSKSAHHLKGLFSKLSENRYSSI